jgi:hypothetical protein
MNIRVLQAYLQNCKLMNVDPSIKGLKNYKKLKY